MWLSLLANLAFIGLFVSTWSNLQDWALSRSSLVASLIFGGMMGLAAVAVLQFSFDVAPGVQYDLRFTTVAVAAVLGGPVAGAVAAAMAAIVRWVIGGSGALPGVITIGMAMAAGLVGYYMARGRLPKLLEMVLSALLVASTPLLGTVLLPDAEVRAFIWQNAAIPIFMLTFLSVLAGVYVVSLNASRAAERALLLGAIRHAPDYFYIKSPSSRFVASNGNVTKLVGMKAAEIKGKSDYDFAPAERAKALVEEEQEIIGSGEPMLNKYEVVVREDGERRHFVTSKTPIRIGRGNVVGIVGATKDVTKEKQAEFELQESRDRLSFILREMSDGVALIRHDGTIMLSNQRYRDLFPQTGALRVEGAFLPAILQHVIDSGEQPAVTTANGKTWMSDVMHTLRTGGEQLIQISDGRWLHMRTQVHAGGMSIQVVSDITAIKRAETNLLAMTKQLEKLAITDGLTRLLNRRGFDQAIEREVARARRSDTPISLLLVDVDRFKLYNDRYGHLKGDECLQMVGKVLSKVVKRPVDVVARYGGEEFAVLLPDTNINGAFHVAENLRKAVRNLEQPHEASDKGQVTVSLGVATIEGIDPQISTRMLVARADEALYLAKGGGRDRSVVWTAPDQKFASVAYL